MSSNSSANATLEPSRKRFSMLGALAILSLILMLPIAVMFIRSYFASDNWKKNTNEGLVQYRSGEGGVEYLTVTWPDQTPQVPLTEGWEYESFDAHPTWLSKPLGTPKFIHNFAGYQYSKASPPTRGGGGGGGGMALGASVTAQNTRMRIPYWPLLIPFAIFPLIWTVRYMIRKRGQNYRGFAAT